MKEFVKAVTRPEVAHVVWQDVEVPELTSCLCVVHFQELQTECVQASVEKEQTARTTRAHLQEKEDEIQVSEKRSWETVVMRLQGDEDKTSLWRVGLCWNNNYSNRLLL